MSESYLVVTLRSPFPRHIRISHFPTVVGVATTLLGWNASSVCRPRTVQIEDPFGAAGTDTSPGHGTHEPDVLSSSNFLGDKGLQSCRHSSFSFIQIRDRGTRFTAGFSSEVLPSEVQPFSFLQTATPTNHRPTKRHPVRVLTLTSVSDLQWTVPTTSLHKTLLPPNPIYWQYQVKLGYDKVLIERYPYSISFPKK